MKLKRRAALSLAAAAASVVGATALADHADAAPRNYMAAAACRAQLGVVLYFNGSYHCRFTTTGRHYYCVNVLEYHYGAYPSEADFYCRLVRLSTNSFN